MKRFLVIAFLLTLVASVFADENVDPPFTSVENESAPTHELIGLTDKTTGYGIQDARRWFPRMDDGAIFDTTGREPGTVLVFKEIGSDEYDNHFPVYVHEPYTNNHTILFTNNYIFFYKNRYGVNILRMTDGGTNHYDIAFGKGPLPTNGIPVLTYSEVSGMVGDNHFVRLSGICHYNGSMTLHTVYFNSVEFNREPVVSMQLRGQYNKVLVVYAEAYPDRIDYYIVGPDGTYDGQADLYWSAVGTIDEVSNKIPEDVSDDP